MKSLGSEATTNHKKVFKNLKKFLTNETTCDRIQRFAASESEAELSTVPCKLNNVKTNYNTLDILNV